MKEGLTRREREITDIKKIAEILKKEKVIHIGLTNGDEPYVVPMNYGFTMDGEGKLTIYLHGAMQGKKLDLIRKNPKIFFSIESDIRAFDGKVACQYGTSYYSVMGKGTAKILDDTEEKKQGLSIFMKSQTGKDFTFNDKLVSAVAIIKIDISHYTAKHRPLPVQTEELNQRN